MACASCEVVPERSMPEEGCRLFVWPPEGLSKSKLERRFREAGAVPANPEAVWPMVWDVRPRVFETGRSPIWEQLTPREIEGTTVLPLAVGATPSLSDYPRVMSLGAFRRRVQAAWVADLLKQGRLLSYFQPIYRFADQVEPHGTIAAYEALSRGIGADGTLITGGRIVSAVTDADLLFQFDRAARLAAVEAFSTLRTHAQLFVNFSPSAIYDPAFCLRTTIERIRALDLPADRVVFEVVETEQHRDLAHLERILTFFREQGFLVALDDFGSGYSNYEVLERLRPDIVKIDMSLIRNVHMMPFKGSMVVGLVDLCRRFGITSLAEGIETPEELQWVREHGVDMMQGFLLGRPAPIADCPAS